MDEKREARGRANARLLEGACQSDMRLIETALADGADVNATDNGFSAAYWAAGVCKPSFDALKKLIALGADVNARTCDLSTPLHHAALKGMEENAQLLIVHGADVNAADRNHTTPLHVAAGHNQREMCRLLLRHGAAVNAEDEWGRTPLDRAVCTTDREIVAVLLEHGGRNGELSRSTALHWSAQHDDAELAALLLKQGIPVDQRNEDGETSLHLAAESGSVELIRLLRDAGADPSIQENLGKTPLDLAMDCRNLFASTESYQDAIALLTPTTDISCHTRRGRPRRDPSAGAGLE